MQAGARARVLEVVAAELDERYAALAPTSGRASATVSQDLLSHRLYGANLPSAELTQCRDLLRKLAGIDGARAAAQAVRAGWVREEGWRYELRCTAAGPVVGRVVFREHGSPT